MCSAIFWADPEPHLFSCSAWVLGSILKAQSMGYNDKNRSKSIPFRYSLNIFELLSPCYVCGTLLGQWDIFPTAGGLLLFCVDILAFAGLAFILMGMLEKFEISDKWLIVVALTMSLTGTLFRFTDFGISVLNLFKDVVFTDLTSAIFSICILIPSAIIAVYYKKLKSRG